MQKFTPPLSTSRLTMLIVGVMLALGVVWPLMGAAQDKSDKAKDPDPHAQHKEKQAAGGQLRNDMNAIAADKINNDAAYR